jgi:hypothetical protein
MTASFFEMIVINRNQTIAWPPPFHDVITSDQPCSDEVYLIALLKCKKFIYLRFLNYHANPMLGKSHFLAILRRTYSHTDIGSERCSCSFTYPVTLTMRLL